MLQSVLYETRENKRRVLAEFRSQIFLRLIVSRLRLCFFFFLYKIRNPFLFVATFRRSIIPGETKSRGTIERIIDAIISPAFCSQMCNEWAIDTPCPAGGRDFCRSLHILDSRGNSVLASKISFFFSPRLQTSLSNRDGNSDAINFVVAKKRSKYRWFVLIELERKVCFVRFFRSYVIQVIFLIQKKK